MITIKESEWGPDYLLQYVHIVTGYHAHDDSDASRDPSYKPSRCCLGFACEQLGVPARDLRGESMPDGLDMSDYPVEASTFKRQISEKAPKEIRQYAYYALTAIRNAGGDEGLDFDQAWTTLGDPSTTIGHLMANINDQYHALPSEEKPSARHAVTQRLTDMFAVIGYDLEFVP